MEIRFIYIYNFSDLLWKAPELLRDENLMLKGTQPGDVFAFSIIMQEVVVRGPPYGKIQLTTQGNIFIQISTLTKKITIKI